MSVLDGLAARLRAILVRRGAENRMEEEFHFHLQMETEKNLQAGLDPAEARRRAIAAFGAVEWHRDAMRDGRSVRIPENFARDLRIGLRSLRRQPGFLVTAVLTLALGIGATSAVFGAVRQILLAPLPYPNAARIVTVWQQHRARAGERDEATPADFLDWRERSRSF